MKEFKGAESLLNFYKTLDLSSVYNDGKSYFFIGSHGTGKSYLSTNILKIACHKNYNCLYTTLSDMVSALLEAPFEEKYLARKELMNADFLVIDEVDNRFASSENASDLFGKTLEQIIRNRFQNKLPTIMCSNSPNPVEMFHGSLKQSIDSLYASLETVIAIGNDFRKGNK